MKGDEQVTGVVLLNMGGPDSLEAVRPFLYRLFSDRDLIQLPLGALLQKPFAYLISRLRSKKVVHHYEAIGGKSPLLHWTNAQAEGIAAELGGSFRPYVAMRYSNPSTEEALRQMASDGVKRAVVLSMYPHYAGATSGSSIREFRRVAAKVYPELRFSIVEHWYDWPPYLDAMAARVEEGLEKFHELMRDQVQIVFSAHALPQKCIDEGDPYLKHVLGTINGVMSRVGAFPWQVGYQSRSGPVEWMEPSTEEVLENLASEGKEVVLVVPVSFVSDHVETLYEIDHELRLYAEKVGIRRFERSPSLNDNRDFISAMTALVRDHLDREEKK